MCSSPPPSPTHFDKNPPWENLSSGVALLLVCRLHLPPPIVTNPTLGRFVDWGCSTFGLSPPPSPTLYDKPHPGKVCRLGLLYLWFVTSTFPHPLRQTPPWKGLSSRFHHKTFYHFCARITLFFARSSPSRIYLSNLLSMSYGSDSQFDHSVN